MTDLPWAGCECNRRSCLEQLRDSSEGFLLSGFVTEQTDKEQKIILESTILFFKSRSTEYFSCVESSLKIL